jgi:hypothetical protein
LLSVIWGTHHSLAAVDPCDLNNGGCQQICRSLPGSPLRSCACFKGFELVGDTRCDRVLVPSKALVCGILMLDS